MPIINTNRPAHWPVLALHRDGRGMAVRVLLYRPWPTVEILEFPATLNRVRYAEACYQAAMRRDRRGIAGENGPAQRGQAYIAYLDDISHEQWCQMRDELAALDAPPPPVTVVEATQEAML